MWPSCGTFFFQQFKRPENSIYSSYIQIVWGKLNWSLYGSTILEVTFKQKKKNLSVTEFINISTVFHQYLKSDTFPLSSHLYLYTYKLIIPDIFIISFREYSPSFFLTIWCLKTYTVGVKKDNTNFEVLISLFHI